ncbi:TonB-dependent receptor domain-containing protein [Castellaniella defragrans]|uniref:TonB-dependent receptor domain-containing protein n=1 Tax=Castellaniella defragrans TaxID=75697 RepID=UPI00396A2700
MSPVGRASRTRTTTMQGDPPQPRESGQITPYAGIVYDLNDAWSVYASYTGYFQTAKQYRPQRELSEVHCWAAATSWAPKAS